MRWIKWAFGEAILRTLIIAFLKEIGSISSTFFQLLFSTLVIGVVQVVIPAIAIIWLRISFFPSKKQVFGALLFGIGAFSGTLLPFIAFMLNANLIMYAFLTLLAIIPGAFIDVIFFKEQFSIRQIFGVGIAVIAGYFILKTPNLTELASLPLWAWLALLNALVLAFNQGITRWVKDIHVWVKNFWGGCSTAILAGLGSLFFGNALQSLSFSSEFGLLLWWSVALSFLVIGMWIVNILAYRDGASIPIKNVVVNGMYLVGSVLIGYFIFGEEIVTVQALGIVLYIIAFVLINKSTWLYIFRRHA